MQPLVKPITINMVNDSPDSQYELLWEANQDDLYILQEGEDHVCGCGTIIYYFITPLHFGL